MAKVYAAPLDPPDWEEYEDDNGRFDIQKMTAVDAGYISALAEKARTEWSGDLVGEVVRFPHADGYAVYMVWSQKPLRLIHLNLHDGYAIPEAHERGLTLSDIRKEVERSRAMAELFGRKGA